jgi:hypothetical protein
LEACLERPSNKFFTVEDGKIARNIPRYLIETTDSFSTIPELVLQEEDCHFVGWGGIGPNVREINSWNQKIHGIQSRQDT